MDAGNSGMGSFSSIGTWWGMTSIGGESLDNSSNPFLTAPVNSSSAQETIYSDPSQIPPGYEAELVEVREEESSVWDFVTHVMYGSSEDQPPSEPASVPPIPGSRPPEIQYEQVIEEASGIFDFMTHVVYGENKTEGVASEQTPAQQSTPVKQKPPISPRSIASTATEVQDDHSSDVTHCIVCGHRCESVHDSKNRYHSV